MENKDKKNIPPFGRRIIERLKDLQMSQEELGAKIITKDGKKGITQTAVSQIISRGATKYLHEVAKHLKTTPDWLTDGTGPKAVPEYGQTGTQASGGFSGAPYTGQVWQDKYAAAQTHLLSQMMAMYEAIDDKNRDIFDDWCASRRKKTLAQGHDGDNGSGLPHAPTKRGVK